jgi:DNA modification methylase
VLTILEGDVLERLRELPDESVQCVVTSPPYWSLRDYGVAGQIGLEPTLGEYLARMVAVFRQVRRVLRNDGTCWVNMGDSYSSGGRGGNPNGDTSTLQGGRESQEASKVSRRKRVSGMKEKELVGQPWRLAFALQDDGWYLRQDIIWNKPNPMPESAKDRCTRCHEYLFLLSKRKRYHWDHTAMLEKASDSTHARVSQDVLAQHGSARASGGVRADRPMKAVFSVPAGWNQRDGAHGSIHPAGRRPGVGPKAMSSDGTRSKGNESFNSALVNVVAYRNKRSVWNIAPFRFSGAHFATFPPDLVRPCILASTRPGDMVLDPFGGSGTTGMVALEHGRKATLIELNPDYVALIRQRCAVQQGLL